MSADNYYLIRKHPTNGYVALMGFASDEDEPEPQECHHAFETVIDAVAWASREYTEYGVIIHDECLTPRFVTQAIDTGAISKYILGHSRDEVGRIIAAAINDKMDRCK